MKTLKIIQILLFISLVGITGTWTCGEITDGEFFGKFLINLGVLAFLQVLKLAVKDIKRKRALKKYEMYTFGARLSKARRLR